MLFLFLLSNSLWIILYIFAEKQPTSQKSNGFQELFFNDFYFSDREINEDYQTCLNEAVSELVSFLSFFKNFIFFSGNLFEIVPARNRLPQFLLRKLHANAFFVSLFWKRGDADRTGFLILNFFLLFLIFRATFSFSSFRILSTKVICKAATDLRKFQPPSTRRAMIMLKTRHTRWWMENCTFSEALMATR